MGIDSAWTDEAKRDIERRGGSAPAAGGKDLALGVDGHHDRDRAAAQEAEDASGNGRPGLQVLLTVKQISIVLGIAVTLATGAVAVWTRDPGKESAQAGAPATAELAAKVERIDSDQRQMAPQVAAVVQAVRGLESTVQDTNRRGARVEDTLALLSQAVSRIEVRLAAERRERTAGNEGGSK